MRQSKIAFSVIAAAVIVVLFSTSTAWSQSMFTLGSSKEEVRAIQGTPDDISRYSALGYEVWTYGFSTVKISTREGKVIEWNNTGGNLKVRLQPGGNVTAATFFTRGSHKDDVLRLQGTPDDISRYSALGYEVWTYGFSTVKISTRDDNVIEWNNNDGNLKVQLMPGKNVTNSASFTLDSHKDDVLRLQGTPGDISRYPALGYEVWTYGFSTVKISLLNDKVAEYSNRGDLKVSSLSEKPPEHLIEYHHQFGDLSLYYDENKTYRGIFSLEDEALGKIYGVAREGVSYFYNHLFQPLNVVAYVTKNKELSAYSLDKSHSEKWLSDFTSKIKHISISGESSATGTSMRLGNFTFSDLISDS